MRASVVGQPGWGGGGGTPEREGDSLEEGRIAVLLSEEERDTILPVCKDEWVSAAKGAGRGGGRSNAPAMKSPTRTRMN